MAGDKSTSNDILVRLPIKAPAQVTGYHGCSRLAAQQILTEQRFLPSTKEYDWLGEGCYFWEYGAFRAQEWAQARCNTVEDEPVVIGATIHLGLCLNLLDTEHIPDLEAVYEKFAVSISATKMPRNTDRGAHYLDQRIIEAYCRAVDQSTLFPFQTVRGSFPEGGSIYAGSKILRRAHTQIAVRDQACISDLHLVLFE
jgi:hypothetical protein